MQTSKWSLHVLPNRFRVCCVHQPWDTQLFENGSNLILIMSPKARTCHPLPIVGLTLAKDTRRDELAAEYGMT